MMLSAYELRMARMKAAGDKLRAAWSYFNNATEQAHVDQAILQIAEAERELHAVRAAGGSACSSSIAKEVQECN